MPVLSFPARLVSPALLIGLVSGLNALAPHRASAGESLRLLPEKCTLSSTAARQTLLVQRQRDGLNVSQARDGVEFTSSNPQVAVVEDGVVVPRGDGTATITATVDGKSAATEVAVENQGRPFRWSFRNHVESVLTKSGCNSGSCHGAALGKKGFRLSLRGYDPSGDFDTITRQARGRRIVPADPGRSLILLKPTGSVAHGGGLRFDVGSLEYRVLSEWIAAATPPPRDGDPRLSRLEILPPQVVLDAEAQQQFVVRAHFSDGHTEDVTRWAKYNVTDAAVADVGQRGNVTVMGHGEAAVTAWYLSQVVTATVTVPYDQATDPRVFAQAPRRNFIDELVLAKLESLAIPPSAPADDAEFLRRAFLDAIGMLPTADEARKFLADESPDKRDRLIDALLERPEFVDYWSYKWSDLLLVNSRKLKPPAMWAYYQWIRNHVAANTPWDRMVADLVTAKGSTLENGATNFFVLHDDPLDMAETTTQAFLGLSIGCAKCHNHPLEKWTNSQYYATANLFARVRAKDRPGEGHRTVFDAAVGDVIQPLTGAAQTPRPLDGAPADPQADRRAALAAWLTSPQNRYFSRAITNRIWANFMGVGLVEAVDDLRLTNPPSNEPLLAALAAHLVENKFDVKALMRTILQSATYQRSSTPLEGNRADRRFYSRYYPRRIMAEVLLDGISQVAGVPTKFSGYPDTWRAMQLPDSNVTSYFLQSFGRPERVITCECERTEQPSMVQVLHISNGDTINQKLQAKGNRIDQLLAAKVTDEQIVEELYLAALSRYPRKAEKQKLLAELAGAQGADRRKVIEDLYWGVLSSKQFLFKH